MKKIYVFHWICKRWRTGVHSGSVVFITKICWYRIVCGLQTNSNVSVILLFDSVYYLLEKCAMPSLEMVVKSHNAPSQSVIQSMMNGCASERFCYFLLLCILQLIASCNIDFHFKFIHFFFFRFSFVLFSQSTTLH